jgi:hypothetical protein
VALLITIAFTTASWVATAFLGPETDHNALIEFYKKVRPFGPGWKHIREAAGDIGPATSGENIPMALLGWASGVCMIWSALFAVGNFLYGRTEAFVILSVTFAISATILIVIVNRLWGRNQAA